MEEKDIREFARKNYVPIVRPKTLEILIEEIKKNNPKTILEIGTAIGYSGIRMLENSVANLVTIEKDEKMRDIALKNFKKEGLSDRVNLVFADAIDYLKTEKGSFDFIFLDGPKGQYIHYLPYLKGILNDGGTMFCDNVLFMGLVNSNVEPPKKHRTIVNNLREFIKTLCEDENYETNLIDIEDGILIAKKSKK